MWLREKDLENSEVRARQNVWLGDCNPREVSIPREVFITTKESRKKSVPASDYFEADSRHHHLFVLDPEQNHNFTDHYLNVAFDLSQVLFIATANTTATISAALLDRMEIIQVPGYTQEEKIEIAHRHLIPKQLEQHGLTPQQIQIPQVTTLDIITRYTREAGVRSLDRKLGAICRAVAVKVAEGQPKEAKLERSDVAEREAGVLLHCSGWRTVVGSQLTAPPPPGLKQFSGLSLLRS
ncbi:lon protease homolog 2, peroxisomal-like isoform X4 [Aotus nancymaae]|uniref:lon protease homolog 2, peroxisomal-like isoform X4 n=1 Tax=Aotus nancymaae TaxID=37293 RepID=UPI0030FE62B1